jgi:hypothetical protein
MLVIQVSKYNVYITHPELNLSELYIENFDYKICKKTSQVVESHVNLEAGPRDWGCGKPRVGAKFPTLIYIMKTGLIYTQSFLDFVHQTLFVSNCFGS